MKAFAALYEVFSFEHIRVSIGALVDSNIFICLCFVKQTRDEPKMLHWLIFACFVGQGSGLKQHVGIGKKCAREQLKPKQSIRKQQTPKKRKH